MTEIPASIATLLVQAFGVAPKIELIIAFLPIGTAGGIVLVTVTFAFAFGLLGVFGTFVRVLVGLFSAVGDKQLTTFAKTFTQRGIAFPQRCKLDVGAKSGMIQTDNLEDSNRQVNLHLYINCPAPAWAGTPCGAACSAYLESIRPVL